MKSVRPTRLTIPSGTSWHIMDQSAARMRRTDDRLALHAEVNDGLSGRKRHKHSSIAAWRKSRKPLKNRKKKWLIPTKPTNPIQIQPPDTSRNSINFTTCSAQNNLLQGNLEHLRTLEQRHEADTHLTRWNCCILRASSSPTCCSQSHLLDTLCAPHLLLSIQKPSENVSIWSFDSIAKAVTGLDLDLSPIHVAQTWQKLQENRVTAKIEIDHFEYQKSIEIYRNLFTILLDYTCCVKLPHWQWWRRQWQKAPPLMTSGLAWRVRTG